MSTPHSSDPSAVVNPDSPDYHVFPSPFASLPTQVDQLPPSLALPLAEMGRIFRYGYSTLYKWAKDGTYDKTGRHILLQTVTHTHGRRVIICTTRKWILNYLNAAQHVTRTAPAAEHIWKKGDFTSPTRPPKPESTELAGRPAIALEEISSAYRTKLETVFSWVSEGKGKKYRKVRLKAVTIEGKLRTCQDWIDEFFIATTGMAMFPVRGSNTPA